MKLQYIVSRRTDGCNPFKVFESLKQYDRETLAKQLKRLPYDEFLNTSYWFAVASVAKANAGMRCQVCNQTQGIQVHHRTYDTHGYEHLNMFDLTVLCDRCHGMFHGHATAPPPKMKRHREPRFAPMAGATLDLPEGNTITLTHKLIDQCRTGNGAFTNATLRAFDLRKPLRKGWAYRLVGVCVTREKFMEAYHGRCYYGTGPLESQQKYCRNCQGPIDEHTTSCEACGATDFDT